MDRKALHDADAASDPVAAPFGMPWRALRANNGAEVRARLRILATSDLHGHVLSHDYFADRAVVTHGLSRAATQIARLRAQAANSLLLDNGDFLFGDPLSAPQPPCAAGPHPMIAAMNAAGYDAATLGNHEFDYGMAVLRRTLKDAAFPIVCANVADPEGGAVVPRYVILTRMLQVEGGAPVPIRIGIAGFVPPQTREWARDAVGGRLGVEDIVASAARVVPQMRARGAELVIALCHAGIAAVPGPDAPPGGENVATALAGVCGIDAIVAGHTHLTFPGVDHTGLAGVDAQAGTLQSVPAVMPGRWGAQVGSIDLALKRDAAGWRVTRHASRLHPVAARQPCGGMRALVGTAGSILRAAAASAERARADGALPVGRTQIALHSHFALIGVSSATRLVAQAQAWHVQASLAATPDADTPILSAAAALRTGGRGGPWYFTDIGAGTLHERNLADLHPHPNRVAAIRIDGAHLRRRLAHAAAAFAGPGATTLVRGDYAGFNFDLIYGVSCTVDLSREGLARIATLRHDGRDVADDDAFVLALNSHRLAGGGGYPPVTQGARLRIDPATMRDVLAGYLADHVAGSPDAVPDAPPPLAFVPQPRRRASFVTGPGALSHLGDVAHLDLSHQGHDEEGFARFTLSFGAS